MVSVLPSRTWRVRWSGPVAGRVPAPIPPASRDLAAGGPRPRRATPKASVGAPGCKRWCGSNARGARVCLPPSTQTIGSSLPQVDHHCRLGLIKAQPLENQIPKGDSQREDPLIESPWRGLGRPRLVRGRRFVRAASAATAPASGWKRAGQRLPAPRPASQALTHGAPPPLPAPQTFPKPWLKDTPTRSCAELAADAPFPGACVQWSVPPAANWPPDKPRLKTAVSTKVSKSSSPQPCWAGQSAASRRANPPINNWPNEAPAPRAK